MSDDDLKIYRKAMAILEGAPDTGGLDGITITSCYLNANDTALESGLTGVAFADAVSEHFVAAVKLFEIV